MALSVNSNPASLDAQRNASRTQGALAVAMARLSSGLRINSARDDAAGLAIAGRFGAQIRGLDQAARNANDGISLVQTAEGGLARASSMMQRMRELAVQSANGTHTARDRASLQQEVAQLKGELDRVAASTQFNGRSLLDGSFSGALFQAGADAGQTVAVNIGSAKATDIGAHRLVGATGENSSTAVNTGAGTPVWPNFVPAQNITISSAGASAVIAVAEAASAHTAASAINAASGTTGVTATAHARAYLGGYGGPGNGGPIAAGRVWFELAGRNPSDRPVTVTADVTTADTSALVAAVNAHTGVTGIRAEAYTGPLLIGPGIQLSNDDGYDILISNYKNLSAPPGFAKVVGGDGTTAYDLGSAINRAAIGGSIDLSGPVGFTVDTVELSGYGGFGTFFSESTTLTTQVSAAASLSGIDIGTAAGARVALTVIDGALQAVNLSRAAMGAFENCFASTVDHLQSTSENLSAARGRIQDADFAMETAALVRARVLQSAGFAVLAQANARQGTVLALLRG